MASRRIVRQRDFFCNLLSIAFLKRLFLGYLDFGAEKLMDEAHLTPIQTRILIALAKSKLGSLYTDEIVKLTGIATSTWSAEQGKLTSMGLIEKHLVRIIELNHISKRMNYKLTEKGKVVGSSLLNISRVLSVGDFASKVSDEQLLRQSKDNRIRSGTDTQSNQEFERTIDECVEIALDSFGSDLVNLVKHSLEAEHKVAWIRLAENTEVFETVLRDYFGLQAAEKLEKLIVANLRSRFELKENRIDSLSHLIIEARLKNFKDSLLEKENVRSSAEG